MRHIGFWLLSLVLLFTAFPVHATVLGVEASNQEDEEEPARLSELGLLFVLYEDGFNTLRYRVPRTSEGPLGGSGGTAPGGLRPGDDLLLFDEPPLLDPRRSTGIEAIGTSIVIQQVHEPQTLLLLTVGLTLIGLRWRPRRRTKTSR